MQDRSHIQAHDFVQRHAPLWHASWQAAAAPRPDPELAVRLAGRYAEHHRHYHTLQHLDACLRHFEALRADAQRAHEITLALWFHDAVYEIGATDNELRSAQWASAALLSAGADAAAAGRVHALVMATRHDRAPQTPDEQILLDVDLAILGAPPAVFDAYEGQVRVEYRAVPEPDFRSNRRRILLGFLQRPRIFHTAAFNGRFEAPARANLQRSIDRLAA